ncbi:MAG: hypothetical protein DRI24_19840 [Deltaproteobacteria bacterium]|nr:MAG: hypothetical protein DRI24_19840 [Deltaproteobacteria bacterium]
MGKSWSGTRKKFGRKKAKKHQERAEWGNSNGGWGTAPRLRSLATDLNEFQEQKGEFVAPLVTSKAANRIMQLLAQGTEVPKAPKDAKPRKARSRSGKPVSLKGIGSKRKDLFDSLTEDELTDRLSFYTKQCNFISASSRQLVLIEEYGKADELRRGKDSFLIPEINAIRLYLNKFR